MAGKEKSMTRQEENAFKRIGKDADINESIIIGLLWSDPNSNFAEFGYELSTEDFYKKPYRFYFDLLSRMVEDRVKSFDDLTIMKTVGDYGVEDMFNNYGGLRTIHELVEVVRDTTGAEGRENFAHYISRVKKNRVLLEAYELFGAKAIVETDSYPILEMDASEISAYWLERAYKLQLDYNKKYEVEDLGIEPEEFLARLAEEDNDLLPYNGLHSLQFAIGGVPRAKVTMLGGFGGSGKSTITAFTVISSILDSPDERAIVVLNEESAMDFRKKLVMVIIADKLKKKDQSIKLDRRKLASAQLEDKDEEVVKLAVKEMNELLGDNGRIKVVFVERYIMSEVENIIRRYANQGYDNLIIDTHKVSEESNYNARWETFVEDMKTYYRLTRKEAGGLNLRTFVTFQLADNAIHNRYLDFEAIGEGKAAKNEASVVIMFRKMWSDEYPDGKKALKVYREERSKVDPTKWIKKTVPLDKEKLYYLLFVPKNRLGESNDTGLPVMVVQPDFNYGRFFDVGYTKIANNNN